MDPVLAKITTCAAAGQLVPYLGAGLIDLVEAAAVPPASSATLVKKLTERVSVPPRSRNNLTGAAQFIENFKHRKTLRGLMSDAFAPRPAPPPLCHWLASLPRLPLLVSAWYDDLMAQALAATGRNWGAVQGVSQAEQFGEWVNYFQADGSPASAGQAHDWSTLLYQPLGSIAPAANFLVSDSDFVEVLTEIDIQTPIPDEVKLRRDGRQFLFLGCRFDDQLSRTFARQILKRSSHQHWAVLPGRLTRNEARFLTEVDIERIDLPLADFAALLTGSSAESARLSAVT